MKLGKIKTLLIVLFVGVFSIFGLIGCGSSRDGMNIEIESEKITASENGTLSTSLAVERDLSGNLTPAGIAELAVTITGGDNSVDRTVRAVSSDTSKVTVTSTFSNNSNSVVLSAVGGTNTATSCYVDIISIENDKLNKRIFVDVKEVATSLALKQDLTSKMGAFVGQPLVLDPYTFFDFTPSLSAAPTMKFKIGTAEDAPEYDAGQSYTPTASETSLTISAFAVNAPDNANLKAQFTLTVYPKIQEEVSKLRRVDGASPDYNAGITELTLFQNQGTANANTAEIYFYTAEAASGNWAFPLQYSYSFEDPTQSQILGITQAEEGRFQITGHSECLEGVSIKFQLVFEGVENSPVITHNLLVKVVNLPTAILINDESGNSEVEVDVLDYYTEGERGATLKIDLWQWSNLFGYDEYQLQVKSEEGYDNALADTLVIIDELGNKHSLNAEPTLTFKSGERLTLTGDNPSGKLLIEITAKKNSEMKANENTKLAKLTRLLALVFSQGIKELTVQDNELEKTTNSIYLQVGETGPDVVNNSQEVSLSVAPAGASMANMRVDTSTLNAAVASVDATAVTSGKITIYAHSVGNTSVRLIAPSGASLVIPITVGYQITTITANTTGNAQVIVNTKEDERDTSKKTLEKLTIPTNNIVTITHNIFPAGATIMLVEATSTDSGVTVSVPASSVKTSILYSPNDACTDVTITLKFKYKYLDISGDNPELKIREISQTFDVDVYRPITSITLSEESLEFYVPTGGGGTQGAYDKDSRQREVKLSTNASGGPSTIKSNAAQWSIIKGDDVVGFLDTDAPFIRDASSVTIVAKPVPLTGSLGTAIIRVTIEDHGRTFTKDINILVREATRVTSVRLGGYSSNDPIYLDTSKGEYNENKTLDEVRDFAKELNVSVTASNGVPTNPKVEYIIFNADENFTARDKVEQDKDTCDSVKLLKDSVTGKYYLAPIKAGYAVLYIVPQDSMTKLAENITSPSELSSIVIARRVEIYVADGVSVYYKLYTADDVAAMSRENVLGKNFYLMNDIDMSSYLAKNTWTPIGKSTAFTGKLISYGMDTSIEGATAHTIFGWNIPTANSNSLVGVFGAIGQGALISDVNFEISSFKITHNNISTAYSGLLAGELAGTLNNINLTAKNVQVQASVGSGAMYFGTVGKMSGNAVMSNLNAIIDAEVLESSNPLSLRFGGLVGYNEAALGSGSSKNTVMLNLVVNNSNITSGVGTIEIGIGKSLLGGAVGYSTGTISNIDTSGEIRTPWGIYAVAGIVAQTTAGVTNCTSSMKLGVAEHLGGIVGYGKFSSTETQQTTNIINSSYQAFDTSGGWIFADIDSGEHARRYAILNDRVTIGGEEYIYNSNTNKLTKNDVEADFNDGGTGKGYSIISASIYTDVENSYLGGIAGWLENFNITESYVVSYSKNTEADLYSTGTGNSSLGGLVGAMSGSGNINIAINKSFVDAKVEFYSDNASGIRVGGLLGSVLSGGAEDDVSLVISNSFATGTLKSNAVNTGLVVGDVAAKTSVVTSYFAQARNSQFGLYGTGEANFNPINIIVLKQFAGEEDTVGVRFLSLEEMREQSQFIAEIEADFNGEGAGNGYEILTNPETGEKTVEVGSVEHPIIDNRVIIDGVEYFYNNDTKKIYTSFDFDLIWRMPSVETNNGLPVLIGIYPDIPTSLSLSAKPRTDKVGEINNIRNTQSSKNLLVFLKGGQEIHNITDLYQFIVFPSGIVAENLRVQIKSNNTNAVEVIQGATLGTSKILFKGEGVAIITITSLQNSAVFDKFQISIIGGYEEWLLYESQDNTQPKTTYYVIVNGVSHEVGADNIVFIDNVKYIYHPESNTLTNASGTSADFNGDDDGTGYDTSSSINDPAIRESVIVDSTTHTIGSDNKVNIGGVDYFYNPITGILLDADGNEPNGYTIEKPELSMQINSLSQWLIKFLLDEEMVTSVNGGLMFSFDQSGMIAIGTNQFALSMTREQLARLTIALAFDGKTFAEITNLYITSSGDFSDRLLKLNTIFGKFVSGVEVTYDDAEDDAEAKFTFAKNSINFWVSENSSGGNGADSSINLSRKAIIEACVQAFYVDSVSAEHLTEVQTAFQKFYPTGTVVWNGTCFEFSVDGYRFADCGLNYIREYVYISGSNLVEVQALVKTVAPINITVTPYLTDTFSNDIGEKETELIMLWQRQLSFTLSVYIGATKIETDIAGTQDNSSSRQTGEALNFEVTLTTDSPDDHARGASVIIERSNNDVFETVAYTTYNEANERSILYEDDFDQKYMLVEEWFSATDNEVVQLFRFELTTLYKTLITQSELFKITVKSFNSEGTATSKTIFIYFTPQEVRRVEIIHFADAEILEGTDRPGSYLKNAGAVPSNTLVAGEFGLLQISVGPEFAYYDSITVSSSIAENNDQITFDQRVAQTSEAFGQTVVKYMQYPQTRVNSDGSITLAKVSNDEGGSYVIGTNNKVDINGVTYTYNSNDKKLLANGIEPTFDGAGYTISTVGDNTFVIIEKYTFDGTFWLRTLTASSSASVLSFTVTVTIKRDGEEYPYEQEITVDSTANITLNYPTQDSGRVGLVAVGTGGEGSAEVNQNMLDITTRGTFDQITVTATGKNGFDSTGRVTVIETNGKYYLSIAKEYDDNSGKYAVSNNKVTIGGVVYTYNSGTLTDPDGNEPDFNGESNGAGYRIMVENNTTYVQVGIVGEKFTVKIQGVIIINGYRRTITRTMDFQIVNFVFKSGQAFLVEDAQGGVLNFSYSNGAAYDLKVVLNKDLLSYDNQNGTVGRDVKNLLALMNGTSTDILVYTGTRVKVGEKTYPISAGNLVTIGGTVYTYKPGTKTLSNNGEEPDFNGEEDGYGYTILDGGVSYEEKYNYNPWGYLTTAPSGGSGGILKSWEGQTYNPTSDEGEANRPTIGPDNLLYFLQHGSLAEDGLVFGEMSPFQICPLTMATNQSLVLKGLHFGFDETGKLYIYPDGSGLTTAEVKLSVNFTQRTSTEHPIPINNENDFMNMEAGKHYILLADIVLDNFVPVTTEIASLDGNSKTISIKSMQNTLASNETSPANYGLFSVVTKNMIVKNVTVNMEGLNLDLRLSGYVNFGGIAGTNQGIITNCLVTAAKQDPIIVGKLTINSNDSTSKGFYIGGLVGVNEGNITNSRVQSLELIGRGVMGGLVAKNTGHISSSFVDGGILENKSGEGQAVFTGGLVADNSGTITSSYVGGVTDAYDTDGKEKEFTEARTQQIISGVVIGCFVSRNNGSISDCYSSVYIDSGTAANGASGFVYENLVGGNITRSYSTSWLKESTLHTPFVGTTAQNSTIKLNDAGTITSCFFYDVGFSGVAVDLTINPIHPDNNFEIISLTKAQFFNTDDGSRDMWLDFALSRTKEGNEKTEYDGVWTFVTSDNEYFTPKRFNNSFGPRLVSADVIATPNLTLKDTDYDNETMETLYIYSSTVSTTMDVSEQTQKMSISPYLIASAADLVKYIGEDAKSDSNNLSKIESWYRLVGDIDLSELIGTTLSLNTTDEIFEGNFDGNGFTIKKLDIASSGKGEDFGLFAKISAASIKNLNIEVDDVSASRTVRVGVLAGSIDSSALSNVNIKAASNVFVIGGNMVGGVAGKITGTSRLMNISSNISTTAVYGTSLTSKALYNADLGKFYVDNKGKTLIKENTDETLCYAGGIAGVIDLTRYKHEYGIPSFFGYNESGAFNLMVEGTSKAIATTAGGLFGLVGSATLVDTAVRKVSDGGYIKADLFAGGIIGENHGLVNAAQLIYNDEVQTQMNNATVVGSLTPDANFNAFQGNSRGIGGIIGLNIGLYQENIQTGVLQNSSSRVRVANVLARNAGGLIGISVGGKIQHSFTTSSVRGSNSALVGGAIGYVTSNFSKINEFIQNPIMNQNGSSIVSDKELYLTLKGVVAYNNWYSQDYNYLKTLNENYRLGGFIGMLDSPSSLLSSHKDMTETEYFTKKDAGLLYLSSEENFFVSYIYDKNMAFSNAQNNGYLIKAIGTVEDNGAAEFATGQTRAQLKNEGRSRVFNNWPKYFYKKFDIADLPIYEHGKVGDVIEIYSYEDIKNTMYYWLDKDYLLKADIDCGGEFPGIGSTINNFTGSLSGRNGDTIHTIYNIGSPTGQQAVSGLFLVTREASLKDFNISGINLTIDAAPDAGEETFSGLVVGHAIDTQIVNVRILNNSTNEADFNGDDAGTGYTIAIERSVKVSAGTYAGTYPINSNNKVTIGSVEYTYENNTLTNGGIEADFNGATTDGTGYTIITKKTATVGAKEYAVNSVTNAVLLDGTAYKLENEETLVAIGNSLTSNAKYIGALVGKAETSKFATSIESALIEATVTATGWMKPVQEGEEQAKEDTHPVDRYVGGLIGRAVGNDNNTDEIKHSYFEGTLTVLASDSGALRLGGFIGQLETFKLTNNFANVNMVVGESGSAGMKVSIKAGGFAGYLSNSTLNNAAAYGEMDVLMGAITQDFDIGGFAGTMSGCTLNTATTNLNIIFNTVSGTNWEVNANTQQTSTSGAIANQRMAGFAGETESSHLSNVVSLATIFNYTRFERTDMFVYKDSAENGSTLNNIYVDNYLSLVARNSLGARTGQTRALLAGTENLPLGDMIRMGGYYPYPASSGASTTFSSKQNKIALSASGTKNHPKNITSNLDNVSGDSYTWYVQMSNISALAMSAKTLTGFYNGAGGQITTTARDSLLAQNHENLGIFGDVQDGAKFGSVISGVNSPNVKIGMVSSSENLSLGIIVGGRVSEKSVIYGCTVGGFIEVMSTVNASKNYIGGIAAKNLGRIVACGSSLDIRIAENSGTNARFAVGGLVGLDAHDNTNQSTSAKIYAYNDCYFSGSLDNYLDEAKLNNFMGGLVGLSTDTAVSDLSTSLTVGKFAMYNMYTSMTGKGVVGSLIGLSKNHDNTSNVHYQNTVTAARTSQQQTTGLVSFVEKDRTTTANPLYNKFSPNLWSSNSSANYGLPYLNATCVKNTGDGSEGSPYLIKNGSQLAWAFKDNNSEKYYKLEADIPYADFYTQLGENNTIRNATLSELTFAGTLDGASHYITGSTNVLMNTLSGSVQNLGFKDIDGGNKTLLATTLSGTATTMFVDNATATNALVGTNNGTMTDILTTGASDKKVETGTGTITRFKYNNTFTYASAITNDDDFDFQNTWLLTEKNEEVLSTTAAGLNLHLRAFVEDWEEIDVFGSYLNASGTESTIIISGIESAEQYAKVLQYIKRTNFTDNMELQFSADAELDFQNKKLNTLKASINENSGAAATFKNIVLEKGTSLFDVANGKTVKDLIIQGVNFVSESGGAVVSQTIAGTISGVTLKDTFAWSKGLDFGLITQINKGTMSSVSVNNAIIETSSATNMGALAAQNGENSTGTSGTINGNNFVQNIRANQYQNSNNGVVGGAVGLSYGGEISGVNVSNVTLSSIGTVGGAIGSMAGGTLAGATVSGAVNLIGKNNIGGLVGSMGSGATANFTELNMNATSLTISSSDEGSLTNVGGFIGANSGTIDNASANTKTLSGGITINNTVANAGGFVGYNSGTISGTTINKITLDANSKVLSVTDNSTNVGGFVGSNAGGTISNVVLSNVSITGGKENIGGAVGYSVRPVRLTVSGAIAVTTNEVTSVGGIIGYANDSAAVNLTSTATITVTANGKATYMGGFIGNFEKASQNNTEASIKRNSGNITLSATTAGSENIGGLFGTLGANSFALTNTSGSISVTTGVATNVGGVIGTNSSASRTNATSEGTATFTGITLSVGSGSSNIGGLAGYNTGTGLNNIEVNTISITTTGGTALTNVGGAVGYNETGTLSQISASGVTAQSLNNSTEVGGLVGLNEGDISLGSVSDISIIANENVGGVVGLNTGNVKGRVVGLETFNITAQKLDLTGNSNVGAIVGSNAGTVQYTSLNNNVNNTSRVRYSGSAASAGFMVGVNDGTIDNMKLDLGAASNITFTTGSVESNIGLITGVNSGIITNITLNKVSQTFNGKSNVGLIVGHNTENGTIETVNLTNSTITLTGAPTNIGGVVGFNAGALSGAEINGLTITSTKADIVDNVGGVAGWNISSIEACTVSNLKITGGTNVGGLVGHNGSEDDDEDSTISIISVTITDTMVSGTNTVGGLVGLNLGAIDGKEGSGITVSAIVTDIRTVEMEDGKYYTIDLDNKVVINDVEYVYSTIDNKIYNNGVEPDFNGSEEGKGYTISSLGTTIGGAIGENSGATVIGVSVTATVKGESIVGGFVGANSGNIEESKVEDTEVSAYKGENTRDRGNSAGGFAGTNSGTLSDIKVLNGETGTENALVISGLEYVGGIAGFNSGIINSIETENTLSIEGLGIVGGITGFNFGTIGGTITIDTLVVKGVAYVGEAPATGDNTYVIGGLVGLNHGSIATGADDKVTITSITVGGGTLVGGLVGLNTATGTIGFDKINQEVDGIPIEEKIIILENGSEYSYFAVTIEGVEYRYMNGKLYLEKGFEETGGYEVVIDEETGDVVIIVDGEEWDVREDNTVTIGIITYLYEPNTEKIYSEWDRNGTAYGLGYTITSGYVYLDGEYIAIEIHNVTLLSDLPENNHPYLSNGKPWNTATIIDGEVTINGVEYTYDSINNRLMQGGSIVNYIQGYTYTISDNIVVLADNSQISAAFGRLIGFNQGGTPPGIPTATTLTSSNQVTDSSFIYCGSKSISSYHRILTAIGNQM